MLQGNTGPKMDLMLSLGMIEIKYMGLVCQTIIWTEEWAYSSKYRDSELAYICMRLVTKKWVKEVESGWLRVVDKSDSANIKSGFPCPFNVHINTSEHQKLFQVKTYYIRWFSNLLLAAETTLALEILRDKKNLIT